MPYCPNDGTLSTVDPPRFPDAESTSGGASAATAAGGRILLADDDAMTAGHLADVLRRLGHEVEVVTHGEAAVTRAGRGGLDVLLLDVLMPRINGLEACRVIKAMPGAGFLPVVLMSMRTDSASRVEGLRVGADDYLGKPIDERELGTRVAAMLRLKRLHDEVAAARARLEEISTHDELTGLYNFRHLGSRLTDEFKRSERHHDPLACLLLDIDGLRQWNESQGRPFGDAIVREIGRALRAALRDIDVVARYGGDEFLVILPSTHFAGALAAADRLFRDVQALSFPLAGGGGARITVSIGVSLFPSRDVRGKDQLLRAAEASLLRSKRDGGDRICVFQHQGYIYSPPGLGRASEPPARPVAETHGDRGLDRPGEGERGRPPSNSGIVAARRVGDVSPRSDPPRSDSPGEGRERVRSAPPSLPSAVPAPRIVEVGRRKD